MKKRTKPDAAEAIAATEYPYPTRDTLGEEDEYNTNMRELLSAKIRKALQDAATHAMDTERMRVVTILNDLTVRYKPSSTPWQVVQIVRENVTGAMSGAPKKGSTK